MHNEDMKADETVLIYSWKPADNYEWTGDSATGIIVRLEPPANQVFAVLVREQQRDTMGVCGLILRWNWIKEDPVLQGAPLDCRTRYRKGLWSRGAQ
jgi:hypothetical protein